MKEEEELMPDAVDKAISVLNRAIKTDPAAIRRLFKVQIPCSDDLADDPDVQVKIEGDEYFIRPLGLINGLFGAAEDGFGKIVAICSDETGEFQKFVKYDPKFHHFGK